MSSCPDKIRVAQLINHNELNRTAWLCAFMFLWLAVGKDRFTYTSCWIFSL